MEEVREWIEKAEKDLSDARFNFKGGRFETSSFLSHQAAEKALKALYILKFKRLWKTHDLVGILAKVGTDKNLEEGCEKLNKHYIETRYPMKVGYTEETAKEAIKIAESVVLWVKRKIK